MKLISEARGLSRVQNSYTPRQIVWEYGFRPLVPEKARRIWHKFRGHPQQSGADTGILNPAFAQRIDITRRVREVHNKSRKTAYTASRSHLDGLNFALHPLGSSWLTRLLRPFLRASISIMTVAGWSSVWTMPSEQKLSRGGNEQYAPRDD